MATAKNKPAVEAQETGLTTKDQYPSWYMEKTDRRTGEITMVPKFRYLEGMPREYRFDGRVGTFGPLSGGGDKKLKINTIAFRFFEDEILGQKERKQWVEIFFIDQDLAVAAILFHTHSVRNLQEVIAPLFYQDLMLEDVTLTVTSKKMESKKFNHETNKEETFGYFLAEFSFEEAPVDQVTERLEFADTVKLYRRQTATPNAVVSAVSRYHDIYAGYHDEDIIDEEGTSAEEEI